MDTESTEQLNRLRQRLFEIQSELQTIAGELFNMAGDYGEMFKQTEGLYVASKAVEKAMGEVKAAAVQVEEWNLYN